MNTLTKVFCKTVGAVGIGYALYDGVNVGRLKSRQQSEVANQKYIEDAFYSSRTTDDVSYNQDNIRKKVFDIRTKNPLPSFWGGVKGGVTGFFSGLGSNLILTISSACALLSKGFMAKVGVAGVTCSALYTILRQGYGVGKKNPMA